MYVIDVFFRYQNYLINIVVILVLSPLIFSPLALGSK